MQIFTKTLARDRIQMFVKTLTQAGSISEGGNANLCEDAHL